MRWIRSAEVRLVAQRRRASSGGHLPSTHIVRETSVDGGNNDVAGHPQRPLPAVEQREQRTDGCEQAATGTFRSESKGRKTM